MEHHLGNNSGRCGDITMFSIALFCLSIDKVKIALFLNLANTMILLNFQGLGGQQPLGNWSKSKKQEKAWYFIRS
jgi:hypothetical protein